MSKNTGHRNGVVKAYLFIFTIMSVSVLTHASASVAAENGFFNIPFVKNFGSRVQGARAKLSKNSVIQNILQKPSQRLEIAQELATDSMGTVKFRHQYKGLDVIGSV